MWTDGRYCCHIVSRKTIASPDNWDIATESEHVIDSARMDQSESIINGN